MQFENRFRDKVNINSTSTHKLSNFSCTLFVSQKVTSPLPSFFVIDTIVFFHYVYNIIGR